MELDFYRFQTFPEPQGDEVRRIGEFIYDGDLGDEIDIIKQDLKNQGIKPKRWEVRFFCPKPEECPRAFIESGTEEEVELYPFWGTEEDAWKLADYLSASGATYFRWLELDPEQELFRCDEPVATRAMVIVEGRYKRQ